MIYKIIDLKAVDKKGLIYVLVHFWEDRAQMALSPPVLRNDFYMRLLSENVRVVVDSDGYARTVSGVRVSLTRPYEEDPNDLLVRETVPFDVPQRIKENIVAYMRRSGSERGNKTWPVKTRSKLVVSDPRGILDRADVKALKGKDFEDVNA